jgi:AIPR protein
MSYMAKITKSDPEIFVELETLVRRFEAVGRAPTIALILWFLETVYRLDQVEAEDAVCDGPGDAGFDAIAADDLRREIIVFQGKRREKLPAMLGDVDLKALVGSLSQLSSRKAVEKLVSTTSNANLKHLLLEYDVAAKVGAGYRIRAIFVANVAANRDAINYLSHVEADGYFVDLWDLNRIQPVLEQLRRDWFVPEKVRLELNPRRLFHVGASKNEPDLLYAAIRAAQLVRLPGIDDSRVFAQNVRLGLGGTRVNDDILESVKNKKEHRDFLTFHNGLTIVSKYITLRGKSLYLKEFSVCNGCQSLLTFYNNRKTLTEDLQVLVRIVRVGDDRRLPEVIAYRTNNQNPISLRDLSSNDTVQVRLKAEFDNLFGPKLNYVIKRGEVSGTEELPNEHAGRLLLALYVKEPWSAHQKYRIFGDLEGRIFNYHVTAANIRVAQLFYEQIPSRLTALENQRLARYGLTSFLTLYFLGELIRLSEDGRNLLDDPLPFLARGGTHNPMESKMLSQSASLIDWLVTELNYFVKGQGGEAYDYKREFKSPKAVEVIRDELLKAFEKDRYRGRATPFSAPTK